VSRDRDHILEQALKHELRAAGTPPADACLDAETLGAWTDGGLEPAVMAALEAHVSNCARCQALVGTLIRSAPGTERTPGTLSLWRWWLAPIAAGVTAVTLWMVVPEQQKLATAPPQPEIASPAQAPAAANAPVAAPTLPPAAPEKDAAVAQATDKLARRDNEVAAAARADRRQEKRVGERKEEAPALQERARLADAAAPAAATTAAAPPPPPMPAAPRAPAEFGALEKSARAAAVIEIATLDPAVGWRIVGDRIERSEDGGKTWRMTRQNSSEGLTAGSAPSNEVCWFVGRAGRVLLTIDSGATFTDVSLVEPLDLASIAAIDARNASVYSVVGRRFRTADGGRTWRPF
jgi:hypothetical protein